MLQIALLFVNGDGRKCMVDTGAAVMHTETLCPADMINEEETKEIRLTGITGHLITVYGTTEVAVGWGLTGYYGNDSLR